MPAKAYEKLEDFFENNWKEFENCKDIKEFLWKIGKFTPNRSLLKICYEKKIPVFCPAISDSGIGLMVWGRLAKGKKINVNAFEDMKEILDIAWTCKKAGVIYLGGGVPKNYIQQSMQFSKGAYYGIVLSRTRSLGGELQRDSIKNCDWFWRVVGQRIPTRNAGTARVFARGAQRFCVRNRDRRVGDDRRNSCGWGAHDVTAPHRRNWSARAA
jgi:deoxyhypusine synthase